MTLDMSDRKMMRLSEPDIKIAILNFSVSGSAFQPYMSKSYPASSNLLCVNDTRNKKQKTSRDENAIYTLYIRVPRNVFVFRLTGVHYRIRIIDCLIITEKETILE